jgi:outer membrane protein OmpA-like peptidoglycan-associated protein
MILRLLMLLVIATQFSMAQSPLAGDCSDAKELIPKGTHPFTEFPTGFGSKLEISGNDSRDSMYFQREHNTAWFWFDALSDDLLVFKIYPKDTTADFDFMLFEHSDEQFCSDVVRKKVKPIRTNISRFNPHMLSMTGLSVGAIDDFVHGGPGNHLSKALSTVKDRRYYLVIDNAFGTAGGLTLSFEYYTTVKLSGSVKDEDTGNPIGNAIITWETKSGEVLATGASDPETGEYSFPAPVRKGGPPVEYTMSVSGPQHFFVEERVKASASEPPQPITSVLTQLKKGRKMILKNINFYGNSDVPIPASRTSLKRILKLMVANSSLAVRIEGHTNGCSHGIDFANRLSQARAQGVKSYLVAHGIEADRISTIGMNCSQMLFPKPKNEQEQELNRRVEFIVVDY